MATQTVTVQYYDDRKQIREKVLRLDMYEYLLRKGREMGKGEDVLDEMFRPDRSTELNAILGILQ